MILCKASRVEILSAIFAAFFILCILSRTILCGIFLTKTGKAKIMQLFLIKNPDDTQIVPYKLARIVFAETQGASLQIAEAMASMIYNIHIKYDKSFEDISNDKNIFDALDEKSKRHKYMNVDVNDRKFLMCLRVIKTMMHGCLPDSVFGATKFHHTDIIPQWAIARGYIAECEDILFYL